MQNPADSEAIEATVKVEIEEDPIDVKPELDLMPTFDRHYVFLPEDPTMDVDLHSATTSVHMKQESDPFTALPSVDTDRVNTTMMTQLGDSSYDIIVKTEPEDTDDSANISTSASIQPIEEFLIKSEEVAECSVNYNNPQTTANNHCEDLLNQQNICFKDQLFPVGQFTCDVCSYTCISRLNLEKHKERHAVEYQCNVCDYTSRYKCHLIAHLRTHSGERPFACEVCGYKSAFKSSLLRHKARHTIVKRVTVKRFQCDECGYSCVAKMSLIRHKNRHIIDALERR